MTALFVYSLIHLLSLAFFTQGKPIKGGATLAHFDGICFGFCSAKTVPGCTIF